MGGHGNERIVYQAAGEFDIRLNTPVLLVRLECRMIIEETGKSTCQPSIYKRLKRIGMEVIITNPEWKQHIWW
jgi:hypothetical protein